MHCWASTLPTLESQMTRTSIERLADDAPVSHPDSWPARKPPSIAYDIACAALEEQAKTTARTIINERARTYRDAPWKLESIAYGLVALRPADLVKSLRRILGIMCMSSRRYAGLGGDSSAINLSGALLYARYRRAKAHKIARAA